MRVIRQERPDIPEPHGVVVARSSHGNSESSEASESWMVQEIVYAVVGAQEAASGSYGRLGSAAGGSNRHGEDRRPRDKYR